FPPNPPSKTFRHGVITGMCNDLNPTAFEESGCAVCGELTVNSELTHWDELDVDWSLLEVGGVTRKERLSANDPIEEIEGRDVQIRQFITWVVVFPAQNVFLSPQPTINTTVCGRWREPSGLPLVCEQFGCTRY
ncbi:hypothetical protein B0H13DRAFT_1658519, partial [Mycena leptocephala]